MNIFIPDRVKEFNINHKHFKKVRKNHEAGGIFKNKIFRMLHPIFAIIKAKKLVLAHAVFFSAFIH